MNGSKVTSSTSARYDRNLIKFLFLLIEFAV